MTLADEARATSLHLLQQENARLLAEVEELQRSLAASRSNYQSLAGQLGELWVAIPPCPLHGAHCYKFALNWVKTAAQVMGIFEALPRLREGEHP